MCSDTLLQDRYIIRNTRHVDLTSCISATLLHVRYPELPRIGLRMSAFALRAGFRPQGFGFGVLADLGFRLQLCFSAKPQVRNTKVETRKQTLNPEAEIPKAEALKPKSQGRDHTKDPCSRIPKAESLRPTP